MFKRIVVLATILGLFFFVKTSQILATSGCGGSTPCLSTKIVTSYYCSLDAESGACSKRSLGTETIDCTATEDQCYGYKTRSSCLGVECTLIEYGNEKTSCCSNAGGGAFSCEGIITWNVQCIPPSQCKTGPQGSCGFGRNWCTVFQCAACPATSPVVDITNITGTSVTITWTQTGGSVQELMLGPDEEDVLYHNCPNSGPSNTCIFDQMYYGTPDNTPVTQVINGLTPGTTYYVKARNKIGTTCDTETNTSFVAANTPTCTISATPGTIEYNQSSIINWSSTDATSCTVTSPGWTGTSGSQSTGNLTASTVYTANCSGDGGNTSCNTTVTVNPPNGEAWWQVVDGDVITNSDVVSQVANPNNFMLDGSGGYPGVTVYGNNFNLSNTPNLIGSPAWQAKTTTITTRPFDYAYFEGLIPNDIVSGQTVDGYEWYLFNSTTLNTTDYLDRKVIIFVSGDLNITGNLNVTDGLGFLGIFVSGNITIDPAVTELEGVYLTDGNFVTGAGTTALNVRGSVVSYGNTTLERSLIDNSDAAEIFTFAPDQLLLFPPKLMFTRSKWSEVAP